MPGRGALFVVPTPSTGKIGPVAAWLSTAGWAAAARRRFGQAWIVTPSGVVTPEEARSSGSRPGGGRHLPGWRDRLPQWAVTAAKDARQLVSALRFRRAGMDGPWRSADLAFVWQRHELFHWAGFRAARALGRPLVLFVAAPQVWEARRWGVKRRGWGGLLERVGERPQLRAADLVACTSEEVATEVRRLGVPGDRVIVTPSGVDLDLFSPDGTGQEARARWGLADGFVVGWVGSFRPFHGVELALDAVGILQESLPDVALLLLGDGQERVRLEALARQRGVHHVVFAGAVAHDDLASHLAAVDVALVLGPGAGSFHYSPIKLAEYMACAKAVVAPRVGQVSRGLTDGVDALLVPPGDSAALAAAIRRLHDDPSLRHALGRAARRRAVDEGSWDHQLVRVEQSLANAAVRAGASSPRRRGASSSVAGS